MVGAVVVGFIVVGTVVVGAAVVFIVGTTGLPVGLIDNVAGIFVVKCAAGAVVLPRFSEMLFKSNTLTSVCFGTPLIAFSTLPNASLIRSCNEMEYSVDPCTSYLVVLIDSVSYVGGFDVDLIVGLVVGLVVG